ncbi:MAG: hypothetical protein ACK4M3_04940 [Pyrobaculum sp.]
MSQKKDRINIAVAREITENLAKTAEELGMTQYALANQILGVGLELIRQGYSVTQIRDIALFYKVMVELETVPTPGRLLDKLVVEMYREKPEAVLKAWCDGGKMLASYIKAVFGELEGAVGLSQYVAKVVPAKRFEVDIKDGEFKLETIGVGYSIESVEATAKAVTCMLEELGYEVRELITAPGILKLRAARR